jgi:hypothetical protein
MILPVPLPIWRADGDRPTIACACLSCQGCLLFIKDNNTLFELEIIIWARDMILSRSGLATRRPDKVGLSVAAHITSS